MTFEEVIENELKCVQRDCCRLENECAKCDLVLPKEEIINAYNEALKLKKEISILLSCKNCPDNKGGLLCQKEYEDKCLAQKIQYIKELKEENADLEAKYLQATDEGTSWYHLKSLEKENAELKYFIRDLIYENQNLCFQFSNTTCLFNSDYRNRAKELIGEKL